MREVLIVECHILRPVLGKADEIGKGADVIAVPGDPVQNISVTD